MRSALLLLSTVCLASVNAFSLSYYLPTETFGNGTTTDIVDFIRGLSKGLVGEDLGQDLYQCFDEGSTLIQEVGEAMFLIENGTTSDMINGIFLLAQIIKEVPLAFSDCQQISGVAIDKLWDFALRF